MNVYDVAYTEKKHIKKKCPQCKCYYQRKQVIGNRKENGYIIEDALYQCPNCQQIQIFHFLSA